jgi:hypothetical protein
MTTPDLLVEAYSSTEQTSQDHRFIFDVNINEAEVRNYYAMTHLEH